MHHPTAIIDGDVTLGDDVHIGPHCVITGPVTIGAGTRLIGSVYIQGPATIGANNTIYPFACIGFAPQSVSYDPKKAGHGVVIGDGNTFRESTTVHRAMTDDGPTRMGNDNFLMATAHVGHDAVVGNHCVFTNSALAGGHSEVGDRVILGGNGGVHQFCRVGRGAMLGGQTATTLDVPPFFLVTGMNNARNVNIVGMRRSGMPSKDIDTVRWIFRTLCRSRLTFKHSVEQLHDRADDPLVREYIDFVALSKRGICVSRDLNSKRRQPVEAG